jgi:group I intron endonuclease
MIKAIYKLTNKINNKVYIGQSVHPEKRLWEHENRAKNNTDNYPIHMAINKYGIENFDFEIIEWTSDYDNRESYYIKEYNSIAPNGYNILEGGHSPIMIGEDHPRNTIKKQQLIDIINDLKSNKYSDRELAKKYNTTDKIIADINHGYSHAIDSETYPLRIKKGLQKLTLEQVKDIKNFLKTTNYTYQFLADKYSVSKGVIYHINKGLTFFDNNEKYPIRI